jgi:hypothetical protein
MADLTEQQLLSQDPEVLGLQRQRALANLLTGQAFNAPQGQMISGRYVKPSGLQQALPMINAAIGGLTNANLDEKQQALAAALRGKQQEAMQNYVRASQGTPAQMFEQQAGPMPSGSNIPQQVQREATGPNYGEMFKAGTSQYASPQLQAAAYKLLEPLITKEGETITQRNLGAGGGMTPISAGGIALPSELKSVAIRLGLDPRQSATWGPKELTAINNQIQADKKATASNVTVHTGNALGGALGEGIGKEDVALRNAARMADLTVQNSDEALKNLDKAITGPNADIRLQAAKYLNVAGADNTETIKASEQAFAQRGQALLGRVRSSGLAGSQGLTEGERKFLTQAYGGNLNLDKETLRGMLMLEKRIAKRDAEMWNQRLTEYSPEIVKGAGLRPVNVPNLGEIDTNNPLLR